MRITRMLAFGVVLAIHPLSQGVPTDNLESPRHQPKPDTQALCKFSDGKTITAISSAEDERTIALATNENLITGKQKKVPAGKNMISAVTDFHNNWTLILTQQNGQRQLWELSTTSVRKLASPDEAVAVSFDQRVGTCSMHWKLETSNTLITLDFKE